MEDNLQNEIGLLREATQRTRNQFLKAEIQSCLTAVEMGKLGLLAGHVAVAEKEIAFVERGLRTIERFLPEVSDEQRARFDTSLANLKAMLNPLREGLRAERRALSKSA
jgi:hypothetical protein